jgi:hypothetical protein
MLKQVPEVTDEFMKEGNYSATGIKVWKCRYVNA